MDSSDETLEYIAEKVSCHECILFLGSAIHIQSPDPARWDYPKGKRPPFGDELSKVLAEKSGYQGETSGNLQRVSQHFESKKTRFRLVEEIRKNILFERRDETVDAGGPDARIRPSPILRMLADLEFPIVITTNYDDLYEQALDERAAGAAQQEGVSAPKDVSIYNPNPTHGQETIDCSSEPTHQRPFILKIHGDLDKAESIVITEEDYIQFVLRMGDKHPQNPFGRNVLTHLVRWPTLFIGYRLSDYNLRLVFKTLRWKLDLANIPPTYAVDIRPDDLIRDVWENQRRYVSFIVEDLWDFVPRLHAKVRGA